ncbi:MULTISPECIES: hypothetical protein [unclassified Prochlorococcus]|uniref:hypothetical protein n=1 Tax=unclassified Prochlorococcus TaxID=2627481 RepID=UPI0005338B02|nr:MULTISPECIES: hypothetical protein [unclassified Prochlorococcus]KGG15528.1 hypothetical protein EV06_1402 [Prochlorococcus sp. MIT 0602]KGG17808.1 hypothetical protein EV07_1250 [Prochlorococcus sp. MIT 0603]
MDLFCIRMFLGSKDERVLFGLLDPPRVFSAGNNQLLKLVDLPFSYCIRDIILRCGGFNVYIF